MSLVLAIRPVRTWEMCGQIFQIFLSKLLILMNVPEPAEI